MIWEQYPTATFVRPPSSYAGGVRQIFAAIDRVYTPSPLLRKLIDDLIDRVETTIFPSYKDKKTADERQLLSDLKQEFQVFRTAHLNDVYGNVNTLARLLASDFALWAGSLDRISEFWGTSGALWRYCAGALDLVLLYELRHWWNEQPGVKEVSEQIYRKAAVIDEADFDFAVIRMTTAEPQLPFDSNILRTLTKRYVDQLVQRQKTSKDSVSMDRLLQQFRPEVSRLHHVIWQKIYGENPNLLLVNVDEMVANLASGSSLADLLKAVIDWAVHSNAKAVVQQGGWEEKVETTPPPDPDATTPGRKLRSSLYLGFRVA